MGFLKKDKWFQTFQRSLEALLLVISICPHVIFSNTEMMADYFFPLELRIQELRADFWGLFKQFSRSLHTFFSVAFLFPLFIFNNKDMEMNLSTKNLIGKEWILSIREAGAQSELVGLIKQQFLWAATFSWNSRVLFGFRTEVDGPGQIWDLVSCYSKYRWKS